MFLPRGRALIARQRSYPDIPGIIISGYADSGSIARKPSEIVVLAKPFTADQICAAICAALTDTVNRHHSPT